MALGIGATARAKLSGTMNQGVASAASAHAQHDVASCEDPARNGARWSQSLQRVQCRSPGPARGAAERRARRDAAAEVAVPQAAVEAGGDHDGEAGHEAVGRAALQGPCSCRNLRGRRPRSYTSYNTLSSRPHRYNVPYCMTIWHDRHRKAAMPPPPGRQNL